MNRLANSQSPYLLQHADNPVDWWPWGGEAFAEAKQRNVPVLLSVGYAACHWCHVMAHESFEDPQLAELINEHFVSVKVDREERPDVDAVYMTATQAMTGQGGWPMTCFLTPDGEPFQCGTYYPRSPMGGMPSFDQLLQAVIRAWQERGDEVRAAATQITEHLAAAGEPMAAGDPLDRPALDDAVHALWQEFDAGNGGFGSAPKFPPSMVLEFLLRYRELDGVQRAGEAGRMVDSTLEHMVRGGIYDQLAGGFARYSVDQEWVVPHFEKMLYDNALLLRASAHAARRDGPVAALAMRAATETAEFLLRDLRTAHGGFAASFDADTDGEEGATYVWTPQQLIEVLGQADGQWAAEMFGVTEQGNFERGSSTLRLPRDPADTGERHRLEDMRCRLFAARAQRPQPAVDGKVVTGWNGMAITALAEAGAALARPEWVTAAAEAAEYLLTRHSSDRERTDEIRVHRSSLHGEISQAHGVLEDYACLAEGLLSLHQATGQAHWQQEAQRLLDAAMQQFSHDDEPGAYFDTAAESEALLHRPTDPADNASPAGASALTSALLAASVLAAPEDGARYRQAAEHALLRGSAVVRAAPRFAGNWLAAAAATLHGPLQVGVVGADDGPRAELTAEARRSSPGGAVVLAGEPGSRLPLLADRGMVAGAAAAYICRGFVCQQPVTSSSELRRQLVAAQ